NLLQLARGHHSEIARARRANRSTFSRMPERRRKVLVDGSVPSVQWSVLFSSIGEVVEWFDFMGTLRWRRCLRGFFSLRTAGRRSCAAFLARVRSCWPDNFRCLARRRVYGEPI